MIPRKIHYCWFSGDPYTELVQECIKSWHKHMPDWEFVLWDYERIKNIDSIWLKECIQERKWAFAADFVRLWAVCQEGGVYLDSDVLVFQSFDSFLNSSMFIGREGVQYCTFDEGVKVFLTSHCFGAEAGHPFLELNLQYYKNRHFIRISSEKIPPLLKFDMLMMPYIQSTLAEKYGYDSSVLSEYKQVLSIGIDIYPACYFGGMGRIPSSHTQFASHLGQGSWREPDFLVVRNNQVYSFKYKIRWRIVRFVKQVLLKCGYCMFKIKIDGYE